MCTFPLSFDRITCLTAFAMLSLYAPTTVRAASSEEEVIISGHLYADNERMHDAILVVELGGESCLRSEVAVNGHFRFKVPVGAKARLLFIKPGYLTKEVTVDTRNALNTPRARKLNDHVRFDVVLDEEAQHQEETYMGPVGYITFVNGTGYMRVRHDERMMQRVASEVDPAALPLKSEN